MKPVLFAAALGLGVAAVGAAFVLLSVSGGSTGVVVIPLESGVPTVANEKAPPGPGPKGLQIDWPCLYGSNGGRVRETGLLRSWDEAGPRELRRKTIGQGYSQPVVVGEKLVLFHRVRNEEVVSCEHAETGDGVWKFSYRTDYVDRYGYSNGPRCTPIVKDGRVYTFGAEGKLHCLNFADGAKIWERDLNADYEVEQGFFGVGATPLLEGDQLITNVGGKRRNAGIVGVQIADGKTRWAATADGASYATPVAATIHGQRHVFVFTEAGLVDVDPKAGKARWSVPFRSKAYESVNATCPLVVDDVVLVSATYRTGAMALKIQPDGSYKQLWKQPFPDSHYSNLIAIDGNVYGIAGRHQNDAELFCCELATGKIRWQQETPFGRGQLIHLPTNEFLIWGERGILGLLEVNPDKHKLLCHTSLKPLSGLLDYPTWTPPVIVNGRMYLRNENTLLVLDFRAP